ncbi:hypothetical protein Bbelb_038730 [Branchiostoma belcheri]|nr:hypothetical protein Bbelb_038730 [Branchiostoma belcheri]
MAQQTKIFKFLLPMSSNTPIQRQSSSRQASDVPKPSPSPSTSNRRAGSRPPPKPGKPKGLGSPKPRRKRKSESPCESGDGDIMFRLKVALKELHGDFEIRAPGNQPIKDALQADTRLKKINKKLHKIYLKPCGEKPPINGEPNIGSPCRVIEGGRFEAKLRVKDQIPNEYTDDQLNCSERDARIDNNKLKNAKLMCKEEVNIKLTTMCSDYDGKTFTCKVAKDSQVSEEEWKQTVANSPYVALSDSEESFGTPDSQCSEAAIDTSQASDTSSWKLDPQGEGIDELDYSLLELEVPPDQFDKLPPGLGYKIEKAVQRATHPFLVNVCNCCRKKV